MLPCSSLSLSFIYLFLFLLKVSRSHLSERWRNVLHHPPVDAAAVRGHHVSGHVQRASLHPTRLGGALLHRPGWNLFWVSKQSMRWRNTARNWFHISAPRSLLICKLNKLRSTLLSPSFLLGLGPAAVHIQTVSPGRFWVSLRSPKSGVLQSSVSGRRSVRGAKTAETHRKGTNQSWSWSLCGVSSGSPPSSHHQTCLLLWTTSWAQRSEQPRGWGGSGSNSNLVVELNEDCRVHSSLSVQNIWVWASLESNQQHGQKGKSNVFKYGCDNKQSDGLGWGQSGVSGLKI